MDNSIKEKKALLKFHKAEIDKWIQLKETERILPFLQENMEIIKYDNDLMTLWYLGMIAEKEKNRNKHSFAKGTGFARTFKSILPIKVFLKKN